MERRQGDEGQTLIMYGVVISGLLFLAFAFFAVAQAGTVRNGGQSAADAAALAAAQSDRDQFFDGFLDSLGDGDSWQDWLDGLGEITADGCGEAEYFAGRNRSDVLACDAITRGADSGYTVRIETRFDTGRTIVPGTENKTAKATATAVVKPLCDFGEGAGDIEITCDGEDFTIDPDDEDLALEPSDLFSVVLVD
ncbi:hypothetical protein [Streptomyces daliensis]